MDKILKEQINLFSQKMGNKIAYYNNNINADNYAQAAEIKTELVGKYRLKELTEHPFGKIHSKKYQIDGHRYRQKNHQTG